MATINAAASGLFSSTSTWSGGVIPGSGDTAVSGAFVVTINDTRTVKTLTSSSGYFVLANGANLTVTTLTNAGGTGTYTLHCGCGYGESAIVNCSTVKFASTTNRNGMIFDQAGGTLTINGNVTSSSSAKTGITMSAPDITLNINGDVALGSSASPLITILNTINSTINISGNVTGYSGASGITLNAASTAYGYTINITGDVIASTMGAITADGNGVITVTGNVYGSSTASAITGTSLVAVRLIGNMYNALASGMKSYRAISSYALSYRPTTVGPNMTLYQSNHASVTNLYETNKYPNMPEPIDVRKNLLYGIDNSLIGELSIPDPSTVASGVATDDTTGTGLVNNDSIIVDFWNTPTGSSFSADTVGNRIKSILTTAESGAALVDHGVGE